MGKRALSVVLSVLMLASILYVGNVVNLEADAVEFSGCIYFDFHADNDTNQQWIQANARPAVWWWGNGVSGSFAYLDVYDISSDKYVLYIPDGKNCTGFNCLRMSPDSSYTNIASFPESSDGLWTQTGDVSVGTDNVFYANCDNSGTLSGKGWYTNNSLPSGRSSLRGNTAMSASIDDLKNSDSSTKYGIGSKSAGNLVELYPVDAVFYDYLTDHELVYGWRTSTRTEEISRTYRNRIPYKGFNNYLSDYAVDKSWNYPLYFGNFTSHWSNTDDPNDPTYGNFSHTFLDFHYGTLKDVNMYNGNTMVSLPTNAKTFFRREPLTSTYTYGSGLQNFSIFANDSEALRETVGTYSGSVQGLVEPTLTLDTNAVRGKKLQMTGNVDSPYFSGTNTYTNTVTTKFPMRVNSSNETTVNGTTVNYTTYEFDSNGKSLNTKTDIVYFEYGTNGETTKLEYTQDTNKQVIDAYKSLGGNTDLLPNDYDGNHRGFFPFDQGSGTGKTIGTDYGFGMRLDIDFNLTEDGYVMGRDSNGKLYSTNEPMKFTFNGDDDVWVFYDGKLALDLGGDHGNASGNINFALKSKGEQTTFQTATVSTHAVTLQSEPQPGSTEYDKPADDSVSISQVFADSDYTDSTKAAYDITKPHTLTVFYMERGLVESNLSLSFSISPMGNKLTVDNIIDYSNVNNIVKSRVGDYIESENGQTSLEKFNFTVNDTTNNDFTYQKNNQTYNYDKTNGAEVDHEELIMFTDQITDGKTVTVDEIPVTANNKYHYTTTYSVVDNFMKSNNDENSSVDEGYLLVDEADAQSPHSSEGGKVVFAFDTQSNVEGKNKYNDFSVSAVNKIKLGSVGLKKAVTNDTTDNTAFSFDVFVKLPHETTYQSTKDTTITCTANNANATLIEGLPVGSKVKFVEQPVTGYTATAEFIELDVLDSTSANVGTFNNTKDATTVSATINASKTLDGSPSDIEFDFALTKLVNGVKSTAAADKLTASNGTDGTDAGKISFTVNDLEPDKTYDYLLEETSETNDYYTCDTNKYWVTVDTSATPAAVKYYKTTLSGSTFTKGAEITSVTFINKSKGKLQITKKASDQDNDKLVGTTFAVYKVSGDGVKPVEDVQPVATLTIEKESFTNTSTNVTETYYRTPEVTLETGWYAVLETKAPEGYELYGKYKYVQVERYSTAEVEFINVPSTDLPTTGGIGVVVFITIGVILIGAAILLLKPKKAAKK